MVVRPLALSEWPLIAEKYMAQFGNGMPSGPAQSTFYGVFLGEELVGFAHMERVHHFNAIYLEPEHRNAHMMAGVFDILDSSIPDGFPAIILPDKNVWRVLKSYGFRQLPADFVWRKDY